MDGVTGVAVSGADIYVPTNIPGIGQTVGQYDLATGEAVSGFSSPTSVPGAVGVAVANGVLYVANSANASTVAAFNATTGAPEPGFTTITNLEYPQSVALTGNYLCVAGYHGGGIAIYNATTGAFIKNIAGGTYPDDIACDGDDIYAGSLDGNITEYSLATGDVISGFNSPSPLLEVTGLAVTGTDLYVAGYIGFPAPDQRFPTLGVYNATTGSTISTDLGMGLQSPGQITIAEPVPEPDEWALVACGTAVLGMEWARRKG